MKHSVLFVLCLLAGTSCAGALPPKDTVRQRVNMDADWKMQAGDVVGQEQPEFNDLEWRVLDLPHDWSIEGEYAKDNPSGGRCGYLPTGVVWYRKDIDVSKDWKNKRVSIEFDSVFMDSTVWLNGVKLGNRPYGYIPFAYDLTPHLKPGKNTLAVRVDNTEQPSARWYTGTGIFGHVNLLATEPVHIKRGGIFFQTLEADAARAVVQVETEVVGDPDADVVHQLFSRDWKKVSETTGTEMRVENPQLWSVDEPNFYTLRTLVKSGGNIVDLVDT
jgi:beta-galactosidase